MRITYAHRERKRSRALARKIFVEIILGKDGGIFPHCVRQTPRQRRGGVDGAARVEQVLGAGLPDAKGQQHRGGWREHAELHLRLPELRVRREKQEMPRGRDFQSRAKALALDAHQDGLGPIEH